MAKPAKPANPKTAAQAGAQRSSPKTVRYDFKISAEASGLLTQIATLLGERPSVIADAAMKFWASRVLKFGMDGDYVPFSADGPQSRESEGT